MNADQMILFAVIFTVCFLAVQAMFALLRGRIRISLRHSSTPEPVEEAQRDEIPTGGVRLYSVLAMAQKSGGHASACVSTLIASSKDEAIGIVYRRAIDKWKSADGWQLAELSCAAIEEATMRDVLASQEESPSASMDRPGVGTQTEAVQ